MRGERDVEARATVLAGLRAGLSVAEATRRAGVSRRYPYDLARRSEPDEEMAAALAATAGARGKARGGRRGPKVQAPAPDAATGSGGASGDPLAGDPAPGAPGRMADSAGRDASWRATRRRPPARA
ncbi:MAG: hypothetical protein KF878_10260 [Planctomycetes bacterium]|nr:hypothetical protein [Planctomycetota bacterium]